MLHRFSLTRDFRKSSIQVGPGSAPEGDYQIYVSASAWSGYVGQRPDIWLPDEHNPLGAWTAACLAAGEAFKYLRSVRPEDGALVDSVWYDMFSFQVTQGPVTRPPLPPRMQGQEAVLAGVGAVGSAFLHVLYHTPGLNAQLTAVDYDPDGIEESNLNRYLLFGQRDLGQMKASSARTRLAGSGIVLEAINQTWQDWRALAGGPLTRLVLSCVDNNEARHAIQEADPLALLSASTLGLRAQLIAFNENGGACLRCRNPLSRPVSDDEVITDLRDQSSEGRAAAAAEVEVSGNDLDLFLSDPQKHCGIISGAVLRKFAAIAEREWSVGFVSGMAGVLLAAEYLKRSAGYLETILDGTANLARLQFWHPGARVNRVDNWPQDPTCQCARQVLTSRPWEAGLP